MKKKFADSFKGLKSALKHKAVMIQVTLALMAIIGGIIIKLDHYEWLAFIICIALVIMAEIINTAIERICDYLNDDYDERIGYIKDLSSAAVLVCAIASLVICIICLIRRFN